MLLVWIWRVLLKPEGSFHSDTDSNEMLTEAHLMQISLAALSDHDLNYLSDPY